MSDLQNKINELDAEILHAEAEYQKSLTELVSLKNQVIDFTHKHLDACRVFSTRKAHLEYLKLKRRYNVIE
jgi:hypothetical protein